jgi:hypothetical protein
MALWTYPNMIQTWVTDGKKKKKKKQGPKT